MPKTNKIKFPHTKDFQDDDFDILRTLILVFFKSFISATIIIMIISITILISLQGKDFKFVDIISSLNLSIIVALIYAVYRTVSYFTMPKEDKKNV